MQKETKLQEVLRCTLESLRDKEYSEETLKRYQKKFHILDKIAQDMNIYEPSEALFSAYLNDCHNKYTGEYSVLKERQRIRVVNLIKSYITNGEADTSRKKGKSVGDRIKSDVFSQELNRFIMSLEEDRLQPNTISTYRRIVAYLLLYCEEKKYQSVNELVPGDIQDFVLYLYDHGYFKPSTISSGLSGLKRFLSLHPQLEHLTMELPSRLPRERKIMEIYSGDERTALTRVLSEDNNLTKRDKAIGLLLLETGLRGVDVCNIKLSDIDWKKDIIRIKQHKTGRFLNIPLRKSYGNTIVEYILNERPVCKSEYLFVRELAPFSRLDGEGASIRTILLKIEALACVANTGRSVGSRTTRHNAASSMLRSGVPMSDISAVLGHQDPNIVSVYLSTDEEPWHPVHFLFREVKIMDKNLSDLVTEFLRYKKQSGYIYKTAEYHLKKYCDYISVLFPSENIPCRESASLFLDTYADTPGNLYNAAAALREFSRYLIGIGYSSAYVIPSGKISLPTPVQPYLFTNDEIKAFFEACDSIPYDCHVPKRHIVLPAMYRLHYCCGLRCKETRTLKRNHVFLDKQYIDILQSKGPKSRRIFISQELSEYLYSYDIKMEHISPDRVYFFPSRDGSAYEAGTFQKNFLKIWYTAFPGKQGDGVSIRAYDFRHHFAYANMNRWLREGKDLNVMLPYLMRYMGHQDIECTLYYFHLVPEIYPDIVGKSSLFEELLPEVDHHA